jgi:hypothetical protein
MSRILRRYFTHTADGTPILHRSELMQDDGAGNLRLTERQWAQRCSGCLCHLLDLEQTRGICDVCHTRECCVHCESRCSLCARRLCGQCRIGFAGTPPRSVCAICYRRMAHRQAMEDELDQEQRAFERWLAHQRLLHQDQLMQISQRRLELTESSRSGRTPSGPLQIIATAAAWTVRQLWNLSIGIVRHVRRIVS